MHNFAGDEVCERAWALRRLQEHCVLWWRFDGVRAPDALGMWCTLLWSWKKRVLCSNLQFGLRESSASACNVLEQACL